MSALRESLRWVLLLLLLIVLVDLRLYTMAVDAREEALMDAKTRLRNATDVILGRVEQLLDTYDRTLSGIGEVVSARGGIAERPDNYVHRLLVRRHAITPSLRWLFLLRSNGDLAELSADFPAPRANAADREYFEQAASRWDQGFYIGDPIKSRLDNAPFIPVSRRVVNDGNRFLGVIAAGIEPMEISRLLSDEALPDGYTLRLVHHRGRAIACLPDSQACRENLWHNVTALANPDDPAEKGEISDSTRFGDSEGFGTYATSEKYPISVMATADVGKVLARWHQSIFNYWIIALGSNALLVWLAGIALRQYQRRRQALRDLETANRNLEQRVVERTAELHQREAQARIFMNTALDAVVVIGSDGLIREFNKAAENMFGYANEEIVGQPLGCLMPADFSDEHQGLVEATNNGEAVRAMARGREVLGRAKDGREFPIEVSVGTTDEAGIRLHVGIIRDISERKIVEQELQRLATTDGLTGVLNRRAFTSEADNLAALAQRLGHPVSLMILDADKFKSINDTYGHPVGDIVLKKLVEAVASALRKTDVLGRLGGEEFGVVLPGTDGEGAAILGERILDAVRACAVDLPEKQLRFTISLGISELGAPPDNLEAAFKRADQALYEAKQSGRNCLRVASHR